MVTPVSIEIVSDVICPWCFIGKRRLEKALGQLNGEIDTRITWLPFQLNPGMPGEGIARAQYRQQKFGSLERSRALDARVSAEARGEGLEFAFERMQRTPNTFAAHQLIDLAQGKSAGEAVVEGLFRAYFLEALDIGDRAVLLEVATGAGLKTADVEARWADVEHARRVAETEDEMRNLGISGVPTFIINRKYRVSGAQPPEAIVQAIREAAGATAGALK